MLNEATVYYILITDICWKRFFRAVSRTVCFNRGFKKGDHVTNISWYWWTQFAAELLKIPQKFQVRDKSDPCDGFCTCWTLLCNISWIVYFWKVQNTTNLQKTVKPELLRRWFPFCKRSMPRVDAINGNQAFQNGRCHICFSLGLDKVESGYN